MSIFGWILLAAGGAALIAIGYLVLLSWAIGQADQLENGRD